MGDQVSVAVDVGGDDANTAGHRLENTQRQALSERRAHQQIGLPDVRCDIWLLAEELNGGTERQSPLLELPAQGAVADENGLEVHTLAAQLEQGGEERVRPLVHDEAGDEGDDRGFVLHHLVPWPEAAEIDTVGDHAHTAWPRPQPGKVLAYRLAHGDHTCAPLQ